MKFENEIRTVIQDPGLAQQVVDVVARYESEQREERRAKQLQGIERARERDVPLGRPPKPLPRGFEEVYRKIRAGELTKCAAAKQLGVCNCTLRKQLRRYEERVLDP